MKKILLILLLTIPFVGFGQNGIQKEYYENGNLKSEGYFENGEIISKKCWDKKDNTIQCKVDF